MNDMTNVTTNVAEELVEQIKDGTAEIVEVKGGSLKSKLITGGIALGATAGAGILGFVLGAKHERKKWEDFEDEDEDLDEYDEYEEFEDEDFNEVEEPTDTKEQPEKKTDNKAEEK